MSRPCSLRVFLSIVMLVQIVAPDKSITYRYAYFLGSHVFRQVSGGVRASQFVFAPTYPQIWGQYAVAARRNRMRDTLQQILTDLYESEINVEISWLWDGGSM